jgi:hypothetical protein
VLLNLGKLCQAPDVTHDVADPEFTVVLCASSSVHRAQHSLTCTVSPKWFVVPENQGWVFAAVPRDCSQVIPAAAVEYVAPVAKAAPDRPRPMIVVNNE